MKHCLLALLVIGITGCGSYFSNNTANTAETSPQLSISNDQDKAVNKAIALAVKAKDYRFIVTSGRGLNAPGIDTRTNKALIDVCGKKYSAVAGDVITSEEQRVKRKREINFMGRYNQKMLVLCRENVAK